MNQFANLRDVSRGLPAGTISEGVLLRSDAPLPGDAVPRTVAWPPATVIDLRHPIESGGDEHPLADAGVVVHRVSLVDPSAPGPQGPSSDDGLRDFYTSLLDPPATSGLVRVVEIAAASQGPVLIHCLAGKDRTGVAVALLLRLAGVDRDAVVEEYLMTNRIADELLPRLRLHYSTMDHRVASSDLLTIASIEAPRALIVSMLDRWDAHPGGTLGWYLENGGAENEVQRLIALLGATQIASGGNSAG
jgi:protein-tyrosine phosphatase